MDRDTEAQLARSRGYEPCPSCGSADVTWRGRRWHESLRRLVATVIEWPFRALYIDSRRPNLNSVGSTGPGALDAHRHWRLREAYDSRVATMKPRIWQCRACGKRGEFYPDYVAIRAEYEGDLTHLERNLPFGAVPDQPLSHEESNRNPMPTAGEVNDDLLR